MNIQRVAIHYKNKNDFFRDADCMKTLCADLRKHAIDLINYEKKEMLAFVRMLP